MRIDRSENRRISVRHVTISMKRMALVAVIAIALFPIHAATAGTRSRAEKHFLNNEPEEAVMLYEELLSEEPGDPVVYKQLSAVYEQLEEYEKAHRVLDRGIEETEGFRHEFLYNKGNLAARQGDWDQAISYFTEASDSDSQFAQPHRNRANIHVQSGNYEEAIADYEQYLSLREDSPQRASVEDMIAVLSNRIAEEQRRIEEEERRAEERARREAEAQARREALRDSVRERLEDQRSRTDRSTGGEEDFETIEDDLDVLD